MIGAQNAQIEDVNNSSSKFEVECVQNKIDDRDQFEPARDKANETAPANAIIRTGSRSLMARFVMGLSITDVGIATASWRKMRTVTSNRGGSEKPEFRLAIMPWRL
jgi:hypothetical protein